jgi:phage FluMu gp28-like protein
MPAILPAISIDSARADSRFLPFIQAWIADDSRMRLAEKSVRIGWTYGDAFKNVRKRLHHPARDYLFATKDQASAVEYMQQCLKFCEIYKLTKSKLNMGEDWMKVPRLDADGKDTGFTDEVRFCFIKFDNKSRIIAFSSNPNAMLVYGGDVGLDEFAAHPQQDKLWETAQGRITMGYDIGVWSAHKGTDTLFYEFAQEARSGSAGWSYYRVTMEDAIDMGYLDLLEKLTGKRWTKEEFIEDCKRRARLPEIYEQAYNCNPRGSTSNAVPWSVIELCSQPYDIERSHLEGHQVNELFQPFKEHDKAARSARIDSWLASMFPQHLDRKARHTLGFDVAASGQGDLACIYVDEKKGPLQTLRSMLTCRTEDWHFIETAASWFMKSTADVTACGDETGLGRQICWNLAQRFPNQFHPVNFRSSKHDMGFAGMNQMAVAEKVWPKTHTEINHRDNKHRDIAADFFALRKIFQGNKWIYSEGPNHFNTASHCDMAWAGLLSTHAGAMAPSAPFGFSPAKSNSNPRESLARRAGRLFGL